MKQPPPLNYIRSFESAARNLSFTAAADELGYTQAAISSHVRALEHYIGRQLFVRLPRSLRLTDMGEAYLPTLRQALELIDQATEAIVTRTWSRSIIVACPVSLAENWLASVVAEFRRNHPDIGIVLQGIVWEDPVEQRADVMIAIRRFDDRPSDSALLWQDEVVLVCSPDMLTGSDPIKEPLDLACKEWISVMGRQEYWPLMAVLFGLDTDSPPKRLTSNSTNIALELAAQGAGLLATQKSLAHIYLQRGLLVEPFQIRAPSPWSYYMTENPLSKGSHHQHFRDWVMTCAQRDFGKPD